MTNTTIHQAARQGDLKRIKALVMKDQGTNRRDTSIVNERNTKLSRWYQHTPLQQACEFGHLPVVQFLVKNGGEVNIGSRSPIHWASYRGHVDIVQYLIEHGADVNFGAKYGTPLHQASSNGKESVVRYLVERKAKLNATTVDGDTPLHWASLSGHLSIVQMLVANGADTSVQNDFAKTPLLLAKKWGHTDVEDYLESMENVRQCHSLVLYFLVSTR